MERNSLVEMVEGWGRMIQEVEPFGDGSDGDVVVNESTTIDRDLYADDLTLKDGE